MWNTDIWMHLRTGQLILERQSIPQLDWYSFTDHDEHWISIHWLFQIVVAKVYSWGGVHLLVLTKAATQMLTVFVCWKAGGHRLPAWAKAIFILLLVICLSGRSVVRPDMVTNLLLAVSLYLASRSEEKPWILGVFPSLQTVWTNSHGLFVLGLVVGGAYFVDRLVRHVAGGKWLLEPSPERPLLRWVIVAAFATLGACLLNPYFVSGALFPLELFSKLGNDPSQEHMSALQVFQRTGFKVYLITELVLWSLTLASFVWLACCGRVSVFRLLLFLGFSYLGWVAGRNIAIFAIVASVICCWNISDILVLKPERSSEANSEITNTLPYLVLVVTIALSISVVTSRWHRFTGRDYFGIGELKDGYIHDAAKFAGRPGMPDRSLVIGYGQAAVFIFHNGPQKKVFMDGRLELYQDSTIERYFEIEEDISRRHPAFMRPLLDQDQQLASIVIVNSPATRVMLASLLTCPHIRLVYADQVGAVFIQESLAEQLQMQVVSPRPLQMTFESAAEHFLQSS